MADRPEGLEITLRTATPADDPLLFELFVAEQLDPALAMIDEPALHEMQWRARRTSYTAQYPGATEWIIEHSDRAVGSMTVDRSGDALRLVDLALIGEAQGQGIGTQVIRDLQREAVEEGRQLVLSVAATNGRARMLYERLGFDAFDADPVYVSMRWDGLR